VNPSSSGKPGRTLEIAGIAGSLRQGSFNRALLRAATELAPSILHITIYDLLQIPLYNGDVESRGAPAAVADLRSAVIAADGLLIATPEYNHGVPGVMKNAIDWLSRPPESGALRGKPAAIMGASPGMTGTARGQSQLRQAFVFTNTYAMTQPEVLIARAHEKFDANGVLTDQSTRGFLAQFLEAFTEWVVRFAKQ
jgi:chromate reductase, NAD(P)H dehydrogenase (quinone)